jgi:DNA/RNA-binding domain of Phe-tRNA-synthetase-like protein
VLLANLKIRKSREYLKQMQKISISEELKSRIPEIELHSISCTVNVNSGESSLWKVIEEKVRELSAIYKIENISNIPAIRASRKAYKLCGKDPARYRLSAEALLRRVVRGIGLYQVNNVVDQLNLVSVSTGYSIGGYDVDKIIGDIVFGIGKTNEPYIGIGRGELNIEVIPVFRDNLGAFGTPTSDSERTSVSEKTKHFLMVIIGFGANERLQEASDMAVSLLKEFALASEFEIQTIK